MTTLTKNMAGQLAKPNPLLLIVFGILALIGLVSWAFQLIMGFDTVSTGQTVSWGIYIVTFFILAGTGSGLIILSAAGDYELLPALKAQRRLLLLAAVACYIGAGYMILMDLGKPQRVFSLLFSPNFNSMFVWDFYFLTLSIILAMVYFFRKPGKTLATLTALAATMVVLIEGWILAVNSSAPLWHSSLTPVAFFLESLIAGVAVLLAVGSGMEEKSLTRLLIILLPIALVFSLLEVIVGSYMAGAEGAADLQLLISGDLAAAYWGVLIVGIAFPVLLLIPKYSNPQSIRIAAILALIGLYFSKLDFLVAGQAIPFMGDAAAYTPKWVEVGGLIGGIGIAAFLFVLGSLMIIRLGGTGLAAKSA